MMITCPVCGNKIAVDAARCPYCGHDMEAGGSGFIEFLTLFAIAAVIAVIHFIGSLPAWFRCGIDPAIMLAIGMRCKKRGWKIALIVSAALTFLENVVKNIT